MGAKRSPQTLKTRVSRALFMVMTRPDGGGKSVAGGAGRGAPGAPDF